MRRTPILLIPIALALAAPARSQDGPLSGDHGDFFRKGPGFLIKKFLGDATPEERESLKAIGKEFLEGARPYVPEMRTEAQALLERIHAALTEDERSRVKGVIAKVHSLSVPEKLGLASTIIGPLNTPEMRADVRLFLRGTVEERGPAGDRVLKAAAAKVVAEIAGRAEIGAAKSAEVLAALDAFLAKTGSTRGALRDLAGEKLKAAWSILTPEQKDRIKGALQFVRGLLGATAAPPPAPEGGE